MTTEYKPTKFEIETAMKVCDYLHLQQDDYLQYALDGDEYFEDETYTTTMQFPNKKLAEEFSAWFSENEQSMWECETLEKINPKIDFNRTYNIIMEDMTELWKD